MRYVVTSTVRGTYSSPAVFGDRHDYALINVIRLPRTGNSRDLTIFDMRAVVRSGRLDMIGGFDITPQCTPTVCINIMLYARVRIWRRKRKVF